MRSKKFAAIFLLFFLMAGPGGYAQDWPEGWYRNADGYAMAVEDYQRTNKPMLVYMSVTWCPYCRRLEKGTLSSLEVREYLRDKIKVVIDPESGSRERAIASKYGVRGFPSLYLHPPQPRGAVKLYTQLPPDEFIAQLQQYLQ
jgi:thioredoxin-related protein